MININDILADPKLREAIIAKLIKEEGFVRYKGDVTLRVTDSNGRLKGSRLVRNLVVNTGLYHVMDRLASTQDESAMSHCAIGDNNTAVAAGDTALYGELGRVSLTSRIQGTGGNANQVTYSATIPAGTGTGTIVEAGIFNASSGGIMLARTIFSPIVKAAGDAIDITWVLTSSAS